MSSALKLYALILGFNVVILAEIGWSESAQSLPAGGPSPVRALRSRLASSMERILKSTDLPKLGVG